MIAFFTGLLLGLSLIIAIGAQNAFVIRQGLIREHVFIIALFCSISDSILICLGVAGISYFFQGLINDVSNIIFGISALWLFIYGLLRIRSALIMDTKVFLNNQISTSSFKAISIIAIFTFANPHVYLDTMVLIGSVSTQFININKIYYSIGACLASFLWFFGIAYGAKFFSPLFQTPIHWRNLDLSIAIVMFFISFNLARQANWL